MAEGAELRVCSTADVPEGAARRFDHGGLRLCVVHLGDDWYAIGDECTHADYSLSEGTIWPDEREIECPKHGSAFSLETGEPATLPALASAFLETLPAAEFPYVVEHVHEHLRERDPESEGEFAFGLDLILDGLERMRDGP